MKIDAEYREDRIVGIMTSEKERGFRDVVRRKIWLLELRESFSPRRSSEGQWIVVTGSICVFDAEHVVRGDNNTSRSVRDFEDPVVLIHKCMGSGTPVR